ncbi:MAG: L-seryl-tRNA(Sec) selenium transferase [Bryobacterales bacterium]|nr:L-seryl-tRNA(Sec) selenium transferase [Bryobacterales bacterium]
MSTDKVQPEPLLYRKIPSVDEALRAAAGLLDVYSRDVLTREIRLVQEEWRRQIRDLGTLPAIEFGDALAGRMTAIEAPSLRPVINATGVILHTNLGRAPLGESEFIGGYSNLEFDLAKGARGKRDVHAAALLERLLGHAAIVLNNNAAATYLVLRELAGGREAIVSRGELIEIGDGFRIPEIMQQAGVNLREVGTTNRTHLRDYEHAINENTALIVRVHASNFRMEGFTSKPPLSEITALARTYGVPVYDDLGSGNLVDLSTAGIEEPIASQSLADGADIISFSGDKLLGGPQCGIVAGRADLVTRIRRHPMYRAFRVDKLILEALERTLRSLYLERYDEIPTLRMLLAPVAEIARRAEAFASGMSVRGLEVVDGRSMIGGGSTPAQSLPTCLLRLPCQDAERAAAWLREREVPIIGRIEHDALLLDLRTVFPFQESALRDALDSLPVELLVPAGGA